MSEVEQQLNRGANGGQPHSIHKYDRGGGGGQWRCMHNHSIGGGGGQSHSIDNHVRGGGGGQWHCVHDFGTLAFPMEYLLPDFGNTVSYIHIYT